MAKPNQKLLDIVRANIKVTHAYQCLLAHKSGKGDKARFAMGSLSEEQVGKLVSHQAALLGEDPKAVKAWAEGKPSAFNPAKDLQPMLDAAVKADDPQLPVNVIDAYFQSHGKKADAARAGSLANLYQMMLEVDRDGDMLQKLIHFYLGIGLPVYPGEFGLPNDDGYFKQMGEEIVGKFCATPFAATVLDIMTLGRKVTNWGMRFTGKRDRNVLADELLEEADVKAMLPAIQAMPAQKIASIGHSYTMDMHWASPSAFVPIATAILAKVNPKVQLRQWEGGGLTASRAFKNFYQDALAWKPDKVFLVLGVRTEEDSQNLATMVRGFAVQGAKVYWFDSLMQPWLEDSTVDVPRELPDRENRIAALAKNDGLIIVEVGEVLRSSPEKAKFAALDHIHMTEPYHRLMAKQFLGVLCGARQTKL